MSMQRFRSTALAALAALMAAMVGCTANPTIHTDADKAADFSRYKTYGFTEELGTDRSGYSTLVTERFKHAVSHELESRGYRYDPERPDLIVNFNARIRTQSDVVTTPDPMLGYGYYGYRYGLYTAWPLYDVDTITYRVGTANIDIVDARRRQLVWEGVAEGELTEKAMKDLTASIDKVVASLFQRYPATAGNPATWRSSQRHGAEGSMATSSMP